MFGIDVNPSELDQAVRERIADSLDYVFAECGDRLKSDPDRVRRTLERIRTAPIQTGIVARYFDLVFAIEADRWKDAVRLGKEIHDRVDEPVSFAILPYQAPVLADDYERFSRLGFASYVEVNPLAPPDSELFSSQRKKILEARKIIQDISPVVDRDIEALISTVIVAARNPACQRGFGGVTSLMLWGTVVMNADAYASLPRVVEFLVHEVTHGLLFGRHAEAPLVLNPPDESYDSPLRVDPRPMDGVYHATVVLARLAEFSAACLDHPGIGKDLRQWAEAMAQDARTSFAEGLQTVETHGDLSPEGWQIIEGAKRVVGDLH